MNNFLITIFFIVVSLGNYSGWSSSKPSQRHSALPKPVFFPKGQVSDTGIIILQHYGSIDSTQQLLRMFYGKWIIVDLWATWCEPCLDEFKFSDSVYSFATQMGISMVYISFDQDDKDSIWMSFISKHHLKGYHLRANSALKEKIEILTWGVKDAYSLPHYLLFDNSGKLLSKSLPQPSSGQLFYSAVQAKITIP